MVFLAASSNSQDSDWHPATAGSEIALLADVPAQSLLPADADFAWQSGSPDWPVTAGSGCSGSSLKNSCWWAVVSTTRAASDIALLADVPAQS